MKTLTLPLFFIALLLASCSPTDYAVERDITINAPADLVFDQINNHKNRDAWSPWEAMDPNMDKKYEGPESGVGAIYSWAGNDSVGTGLLEIVNSKPNSYIESELTFTDPFEAHSTVIWTFDETPEGTKATWKITGQLPGYLFWMDKSDMETQMAPDLEEGLLNLKRVSEEKMQSTTNQELTSEVVTVESMPYYYISDETAISSLSAEFFSNRFGQIMNYLGEDSQNMTRAPFAIFQKWNPDDDRAEIEVAVACISDKPGNEIVKKGMTYSGKIMKCVFTGPYEETGQAHSFLEASITEGGYRVAGAPWEEFVNDPQDVSGPEEYITEVCYPVAKID